MEGQGDEWSLDLNMPSIPDHVTEPISEAGIHYIHVCFSVFYRLIKYICDINFDARMVDFWYVIDDQLIAFIVCYEDWDIQSIIIFIDYL